jgi:hypothetical protein
VKDYMQDVVNDAEEFMLAYIEEQQREQFKR